MPKPYWNSDTLLLLDKLMINHLTLPATIGFFTHEKTNKQPIHLSIEIFYHADDLEGTDDPEDCIDYQKITNHITHFIGNHAFHLLETLSQKISELILQYDQRIKATKIRIDKPQALEHCDSSAIEILRFQKAHDYKTDHDYH